MVPALLEANSYPRWPDWAHDFATAAHLTVSTCVRESALQGS